jgi:hypothetical protein
MTDNNCTCKTVNRSYYRGVDYCNPNADTIGHYVEHIECDYCKKLKKLGLEALEREKK